MLECLRGCRRSLSQGVAENAHDGSEDVSLMFSLA